MSNEFIQSESRYLAGMLDQGRGDVVNHRLHEDLQRLAPSEFNAVVRQTALKEQKGVGDDISIQSDGSIVISHTANSVAGRLYPERQAVVTPLQPNRGAVEQPCDTTQQTTTGATVGSFLGAIGGALLKGNDRGAGPGAVIGAITGGVIGHANAKESCSR